MQRFDTQRYRLAIAVAIAATSHASLHCLPPNNVPPSVKYASYISRVTPTAHLNLTIILKAHDQDLFDDTVQRLFDPSSSSYHHWLTSDDLEPFAPTASEFKLVVDEMVEQGFSIDSADPLRFWVRIHGTAAAVEREFNTELGIYRSSNRVFQAHNRDASIAGPAARLIESVVGLDRQAARPQVSYITNLVTNSPAFELPLQSEDDPALFRNSLSDTPITTSATASFNTAGSLPTAKYVGLQWFGLTNLQNRLAGFSPDQLAAHYGVTSLRRMGFDGTGQRIAIVEAYGYPEAEEDANEAAALFNLKTFGPDMSSAVCQKDPPLSDKFSIVCPEGPPSSEVLANQTSWTVQTAVDIQAAHAIAPGASIVLVTSAGQDNEDQIASLTYLIRRPGSNSPLAYIVSCGWEIDEEISAGPLEEIAFNMVLEQGSAMGISFQFASGDSGDNGAGGTTGGVGVPSDSPFATAVGGTSILNNPYDDEHQVVTGWGNSVVYAYYYGVEDPLQGEFLGGSGGGASTHFPKPLWQATLPGKQRRVPDVAALADVYCGFPVIFTQQKGGKQVGRIVGGTSVATSIFSGIWAVANQYYQAHNPALNSHLGEAAPLISRLRPGEIIDVVPPPSDLVKHNVEGMITDVAGNIDFSSNAIFDYAKTLQGEMSPRVGTDSPFLSVIWNAPSFGQRVVYQVISFGTDSSMPVTKGWDEVTGWGEPNGLPFVEGVTREATGTRSREVDRQMLQ